MHLNFKAFANETVRHDITFVAQNFQEWIRQLLYLYTEEVV